MTNLTKILSHGALVFAMAAAAIPASAETPAKSVCTVRNADAAIRNMTPVDLPPLAAMARLSGTAVVQLELDEKGAAHNAVVVKSSGSELLDEAARKAALQQDYAPEIRDCDNIGGSYRVVVDFSPDVDN